MVEPLGRKPLDLVFLGCGAATRMHARTISRLGAGVRLHFASRDPARAAAFRDRAAGAGAYGSYADALADARIDVALVATPPGRHRALVLDALAAGKHVVVEKPAFPASAAFETVAAAGARAGRRVLVAENYFYKPLRRRLAEILAAGLIGEPLLLHVNALKGQDAAGWRTEPALAGGGALMEGGVHWMSLMANLGLAVEGIAGRRIGTEVGDRETVLVTFYYAGGAVGTLSYSWRIPAPLGGLRLSKVFGREGSVTFESNGAFVFVRGRRMRLHVPDPRDAGGYKRMFRDFFDALRTGREPAFTLEAAARDVRLVEAAYRSMDREWEPIDD